MIKVKDLPNLVRDTRQQRGLSFRTAATQIGVSHTTIQRLEDGRIPKLTTCERILEWVGNAPPRCEHCGQVIPS